MGQIAADHEVTAGGSTPLLEAVDAFRRRAFGGADSVRRRHLGQFATPPCIARLMASMFQDRRLPVRLLDAGAGVGSLTAAYVADVCRRRCSPERITVTAVEIEPAFTAYLERTLQLCASECRQAGKGFNATIRREDFISGAVSMLTGGLFGSDLERFDCAILNPPYKKLNADSVHRRLLRQAGIETSNLYTAFLALAIMLLEPGGELVAITPRSFCNGPYFRPFRELLLREMSLRHIHIFESRNRAFAEDDVLQENIILHAVKVPHSAGPVTISSNTEPTEKPTVRQVRPEALVNPGDPEGFIHIVPDDAGSSIADTMSTLGATLDDTGLSVSTGRVVDFRCRGDLRMNPTDGTVPLIYPVHFANGWINWPRLGYKKPNACVVTSESAKLLIPAGTYVLVKRFSAKEERRRVVAAIFDPSRTPCEMVAFENHLNYFHQDGKGMSMHIAKGLVAFLNSTLVDAFFRQFSGHTQVNATDLRNLRYPSIQELEGIGARIGDVFPDQEELDQRVNGAINNGRAIGACKRRTH